PSLRAASIDLGRQFEIDLPHPKAIKILGGDLMPAGELTRDSTNPADLLFLEQDELRVLAHASCVSGGKLYHRAAEIMPTIEPIERWNSAGEQKLWQINQAAGVDIAYRRPRAQVAHRAVRQLAARLIDSSRVLEKDWSELEAMLVDYDAEAFRMV